MCQAFELFFSTQIQSTIETTNQVIFSTFSLSTQSQTSLNVLRLAQLTHSPYYVLLLKF